MILCDWSKSMKRAGGREVTTTRKRRKVRQLVSGGGGGKEVTTTIRSKEVIQLISGSNNKKKNQRSTSINQWG